MDFSDFPLNTTTLHKGDVLYLYTDGVTEAHNKDEELFGEDRLLDVLNENQNLSLEEIDDGVRKRVSDFEGDLEQYDDMTTLCFRFFGKEK